MRTLVLIAAFHMVSVFSCQSIEHRDAIADITSEAFELAPFCPEMLYEEVPKNTCPPEPCLCFFPIPRSTPFDEFPEGRDDEEGVTKVISKRHLVIRVAIGYGVLDVHRVAREYLHGEVTQQSWRDRQYTIRLLLNARWDVNTAIARARKHPMILGAWSKTFSHPHPTHPIDHDAPRK
jgi:hypothetical protein